MKKVIMLMMTGSLITVCLQGSVSRMPQRTYSKGSHIGIRAVGDDYSVCDEGMGELYTVQSYDEQSYQGGKKRILVVAKDGAYKLCGFPLYKDIITFEEIIDGKNVVKSAPGGPSHQRQVTQSGMGVIVVLGLGFGGMLYKLLKKIQELSQLQEQQQSKRAHSLHEI